MEALSIYKEFLEFFFAFLDEANKVHILVPLVSFCSVSSKRMLKTLGNISLVFLGLMTGLVRCEISSCYKVGPAPEYSRMFYSSHSEVDQSWINSTLLDLVQPVPDYKECQVVCQVRKTTLH